MDIDEVQKIATLYTEALENEFPWYHFHFLVTGHRSILRVSWQFNVNYKSISYVFIASFYPDYIKIERNYWPVYCVKYADPWFTEDILSRILRDHTNHTLRIYKDVPDWQKDGIFC